MALAEISCWFEEFAEANVFWYVKRLSGNDTLANGTHQAGPHINKEFLFQVFPALNQPQHKNPEVWFEFYLDSHADCRNVRAVWYNNKLFGGTRNEAHLTGFGGQNSALLDPDSTGALTLFAFRQDKQDCHVWVCRNAVEEDFIEDRIGTVEPAKALSGRLGQITAAPCTKQKNCWLTAEYMPSKWLNTFPTATEIVQMSIELRKLTGFSSDERLIKRRECEFELFRSVEQALELPNICIGFTSIEEFIARAQTILQRRKNRAGRSLELHLREIFKEESLTEHKQFSFQPRSEGNKRPDFLFPSQAAYQDVNFPADKLRMLAVKTTCKDRWRQILNEADRIPQKHLLTLQEGISESQFKEMQQANVHLVVPKQRLSSFPRIVQPQIQTLESFIADVRLLNLQHQL